MFNSLNMTKWAEYRVRWLLKHMRILLCWCQHQPLSLGPLSLNIVLPEKSLPSCSTCTTSIALGFTHLRLYKSIIDHIFVIKTRQPQFSGNVYVSLSFNLPSSLESLSLTSSESKPSSMDNDNRPAGLSTSIKKTENN